MGRIRREGVKLERGPKTGEERVTMVEPTKIAFPRRDRCPHHNEGNIN